MPDLDASKRIKHKVQQSTSSNNTVSSSDSQQTINTPSSQRADSSSNITHWPNDNGHVSTSRSSTIPNLTVGIGDLKRQRSPNTTSPTVLPGYRESIFGQAHQSLPWRDGQRNERIPSAQPFPHDEGDSRASYQELPATDNLSLAGSAQIAHRTRRCATPSLLTSDSTNRSSIASPSTGSSVFFNVGNPLTDPPLFYTATLLIPLLH